MMIVVKAYVGGKIIDPSDNVSVLPPMVKSLLIEGIAQNTTGSVFVPEGGGNAEVSGSPTERAILQWGVKLGMNFDAIRSNSSIIHLFPFNSEKRQGGVALKLPDSEIHIHWKGAAEIVLASCTRYIDANDNFIPMDEDKVALFQTAIEDMAAGSLRCVAIAYTSCKMENVPTDEEELAHWKIPKNDLVLLAIVGLKDPCRSSAKDTVRLCQSAGVKVRLVTSDSLPLARAIALECGILDSGANGSELTEGMTFGALSEVKRQGSLENITVMARSSSSEKRLLVQDLMKQGHIVAVTGDSAYDAPALYEADIGLAMGIQGTEVVKQSSDIIILDDNFASAVKVVRWGRSIYANIQKFIQFQLTGTITALVVDFVCAVSSGDVPLNAVQILWINLVMDALGGLALATEAPTDHLMHRPPVEQREPLITNIMWRNILIQVIYQVTILLVINFQGESFLNHHSIEYTYKLKNAMTQNTLVICQIFNGFNARKPDEINIFKGITRNRLFMVIVGLTLVLQVIIIEFLAKYTSSVRLNWRLWLVSFALGFISWPVAVIGKLIPVPVKPISECFARSHLQRAPTSNH